MADACNVKPAPPPNTSGGWREGGSFCLLSSPLPACSKLPESVRRTTQIRALFFRLAQRPTSGRPSGAVRGVLPKKESGCARRPADVTCRPADAHPLLGALRHVVHDPLARASLLRNFLSLDLSRLFSQRSLSSSLSADDRTLLGSRFLSQNAAARVAQSRVVRSFAVQIPTPTAVRRPHARCAAATL
ncbi:hypothetical protein MRX96_017172 [Rhipicephalus microplus]